MATPHVAGVAALIKAQFPLFKSNEIKAKLLETVEPIESLEGITVTGGRLNAYNIYDEDTIAPSAVNIGTISPTSPTLITMTLNWIATGDDNNNGRASSYDIRYSTSNIIEENWNGATKIIGEPKPKSSGSSETFTVMGLLPNMTYYFAMKVLDNVGNPSGLSNVVSGKTITPTIVFYDDMENGKGFWQHKGYGDVWELGIPTSGPSTVPSGSNVWATNLSGLYDIYMDAYLTSPTIDLNGLESALLTFQNYYITDPTTKEGCYKLGYDGGIVEISIGGKSWTQIMPVGGYPMDVLSANNPICPDVINQYYCLIPVYSGYSGNGTYPPKWQISVFDISSYVNKKISIRFRFGSDWLGNAEGWYIDDVSILGKSTSTETNKTMHIYNIEMSTYANKNTNAVATVTVVDNNDNPVNGAMVSGNWSGLTSDTDARSTDVNGKVVIESDRLKNPIGNFTFTVNNVVLNGWEYRPYENKETSDTIIVP